VTDVDVLPGRGRESVTNPEIKSFEVWSSNISDEYIVALIGMKRIARETVLGGVCERWRSDAFFALMMASKN
jgi:hypothetical protein